MDYLSSKTFFHTPSHLLSSYLSRTCVPTGCQGRIAFRGFFSCSLRNRATGPRRRRGRRKGRETVKEKRGERERERQRTCGLCHVKPPLHPSRTRNTKDERGEEGWATGSDKIQQLAPNWRLLTLLASVSPVSRGGPLPPITDRPEFT